MVNMKPNETTEFMINIDSRYRLTTGLIERKFYSIFYSRVDRCDLFILGYNPGGDPDSWSEDELASTTYFEKYEHEYVDKNYKIAKAMRAFLINVLSLDSAERIRQIPKSNIIFRRSSGSNKLSISKNVAINEAKPFVEEMLSRALPKTVLLEGKETYDLFLKNYCTEVKNIDLEPITTPNGTSAATLFMASTAYLSCLGERVNLIGIGHPSKFSDRAEWRLVLRECKQRLSNSCNIEHKP